MADEDDDTETGEEAEVAAEETRPVPQGKPPIMGNEGGVLVDGTGDFAPGEGLINFAPSTGVGGWENTTTVQDENGNDIEVPVGIDGENPVSSQNPHPRQVGVSYPTPLGRKSEVPAIMEDTV